jgi:hypothetical protein
MTTRSKASLITRLDGLERQHPPKTHRFWLDRRGPDFETRKNELIASGEAQEGDCFVAYRWRSSEDPPASPPQS